MEIGRWYRVEKRFVRIEIIEDEWLSVTWFNGKGAELEHSRISRKEFEAGILGGRVHPIGPPSWPTKR